MPLLPPKQSDDQCPHPATERRSRILLPAHRRLELSPQPPLYLVQIAKRQSLDVEQEVVVPPLSLLRQPDRYFVRRLRRALGVGHSRVVAEWFRLLVDDAHHLVLLAEHIV